MEFPHPHRGLAQGRAVGRIDLLERLVPLLAGHFHRVEFGAVEFADESEQRLIARFAHALDNLAGVLLDVSDVFPAPFRQTAESGFETGSSGLKYRENPLRGGSCGHVQSSREIAAPSPRNFSSMRS